MNEFIKVNILKPVNQLAISAVFIPGRCDLSTPLALVEKFYQSISAPKKELIILENSAHMPQLEEFVEFNKIIINAIIQ